MSNKRLLLIDLSALFYPAWHAFSDKITSEAFSATMRAVERCQKMVPDSDVVVCCDGRGNWRKDLAPSYKAHREKAPAAMYGLLDRVKEALKDAGHLLVTRDGFEADDIIQTYVTMAKDRGVGVTIASHDKDLTALIDDAQDITCLRTATWVEYKEKDVIEKLGVKPNQVQDWLSLVGDASDGITGCTGVGPKTATKLLNEYNTLVSLYEFIDDGSTTVSGKVLENLSKDREQVRLARQLVEMKFIPDIDFDEIYKPRETAATKKGMPKMEDDIVFDDARSPTDVDFTDSRITNSPTPEEKVQAVFLGATVVQKSEAPHIGAVPAAHAKSVVAEPVAHATDVIKTPLAPARETAIVAVPVEYARALEPANMARCFDLATVIYESKLYQKFASPQAIAAVIVRGRELGLGAMTSLAVFHVVEGTPMASADLIAALAERDANCEYLMMISCSAIESTWETKHRKHPRPTRYTYTIEMARLARLLEKEKGNWNTRPQDMLVKTAKSKLARLVYPGSVMGLIAIEETDNE